MRNIKGRIDDLIIKGKCKWNGFCNEEKGDTNFISIAVIIAIVVVLAGIFLTLGETSMNKVSNKVNNFIK